LFFILMCVCVHVCAPINFFFFPDQWSLDYTMTLSLFNLNATYEVLDWTWITDTALLFFLGVLLN
jgi:hypothetical protein